MPSSSANSNNAGRDPRTGEFFRLFNAERFFEAHEVLEALWRVTSGPEKDFYQALIQIAAAFVHIQKGNRKGALRLWETASASLARFGPFHGGLDLARLGREAGDGVRECRFPKIHLAES